MQRQLKEIISISLDIMQYRSSQNFQFKMFCDLISGKRRSSKVLIVLLILVRVEGFVVKIFLATIMFLVQIFKFLLIHL